MPSLEAPAKRVFTMIYKSYTASSLARDEIENIPFFEDYCITGADHNNQTNHCFSEFHLWRLIKIERNHKIIEVWKDEGWVSPKILLNILIEGRDKLYSGKELLTSIQTGEKIEVEFRITHNGSSFDLSRMPTKP